MLANFFQVWHSTPTKSQGLLSFSWVVPDFHHRLIRSFFRVCRKRGVGVVEDQLSLIPCSVWRIRIWKMCFALFRWGWDVGGVKSCYFKNTGTSSFPPLLFARGLLAESVNKDIRVKLTLSQSNLLSCLLSRFVELGSSETTSCCDELIHHPSSALLGYLKRDAGSKRGRAQTAALKEPVLQEPRRWGPFWFYPFEVSFRERESWDNPSPSWPLFPSMFFFLCPTLTG